MIKCMLFERCDQNGFGGCCDICFDKDACDFRCTSTPNTCGDVINERLTIQTETGAALKLNNPSTENEARDQLMAAYKVAINKLAAFEDAVEQGFIVTLPFIIGTDRIVARINGEIGIIKCYDHEDAQATLRDLLKADEQKHII